MSDADPNLPASPPSATSGRPLFTPPAAARTPINFVPWAIAGVVILCVLGGLLLVSRRHHAVAPNTPLPEAANAASLPLSGLAMSESSSYSGGKSTFLDGHIGNTGSQTVTAVTVQVMFRNEENMPPQVETMPLALVRTHEPYVDTQPVSADPLKPGDDKEFRLIFETLPQNWNQQMPEVHIVAITAR